MKVAKVLLAGLVVCMGYAADFSSKSNDELVKINGTLKSADDAADLKLEILKRVNTLEESAKKDFIDKLKASYEKNTENMKVKDLRAYEANVKKAFKAKIEKLSDKDKEAFGLNAPSCPHHSQPESSDSNKSKPQEEHAHHH